MFISPSSCSSLVPWTIFRTSIISSCCGFVVGGFSIYQPFFRVVANRHPRHSVFTNCVATLPRLIIYGDPNSLLHSVPSWPSQRHQRAPAYSALFPDWSTTSVEAWTRANRTFLGDSSRFVVLYLFYPKPPTLQISSLPSSPISEILLVQVFPNGSFPSMFNVILLPWKVDSFQLTTPSDKIAPSSCHAASQQVEPDLVRMPSVAPPSTRLTRCRRERPRVFQGFFSG